MDSAKAIAKHIKQVESDPQADQIHFMCDQCTELPPNTFHRKQKKLYKSRWDTSSITIMKKNNEGHQCTRNMKHMQAQVDVKSVVIQNMLRDLDVQLASTNVKIAISLAILVACATRRKSLNTRGNQVP